MSKDMVRGIDSLEWGRVVLDEGNMKYFRVLTTLKLMICHSHSSCNTECVFETPSVHE